MPSFLNRADLPRGIRNNNPGNLIQTNIQWQGKIPNPTDSRFEQFYDVVFGLRALLLDLRTDTQRYNGNVRQIIAEFAPAFENNTASYQNNIVSMIGSETVRVCRKDLIKLAKAIVIIENGQQYAPLIDNRWYEMAADKTEIPKCSQIPKQDNSALIKAAALFLLSQL